MTYRSVFIRCLALLFFCSTQVVNAQDGAVPRINTLMITGKFDDALQACNELIERSPKHREVEYVRLMRAQCNSALGNAAEAAKNYDELIELHPKFAHGYLGRGWIKCQTLDFEEAVKDFETGFRQESRSIESDTKGGFAPSGMDWKKLGSTLESGLAKEHTHRVYLFVRALAKIEQRDHRGAIDDLTALIMALPQYAYAHHLRGNARLNLGQPELATEDFETAVKLEPNDLGASQMAKILNKKLEGLRRLNATIALNPEIAPPYIARGNFRVVQHNFAAAVVDFDKAIEIEPGNANYLTLRALAKENMDDFKGAIKDYDELIRIDSKKFESHLTARSACKLKAGDYAGAIDDYNELIAINPKAAYLYSVRGAARNRMSDYAAALKDYDEAIQLGEQSARQDRAYTRLMLKDYPGVFEDTDHLIKQDPKHPVAYQLRAMAWRKTRKFNEAIGELNEAIRQDANNPGNLEHRGYCKLYLKNYAGALADFDQALALVSLRNARCGKAVVLAIADSDLRNPAESLRIAEEALSKKPNGYDQNAKACALAAQGKYAEAIALEKSIDDPSWLNDDELLGGILAPQRIAAWEAGKQWQP